jgi:glycosyltransferase involved in cell wall biosynthesis
VRILVISNLYPPEVLGGYEILCHQVCQDLIRRGHQVLVLTTGQGDQAGVSRQLRLVAPFSRPAHRDRLATFRCHWHNRRVTAQTIDRFAPDVVFFWSQLRLSLGSLRAVQDQGCKALYTLNDDHLKGYLPAPWKSSPRGLLAWLLDRTMARHLTLQGITLPALVAISEKLKSNLLELGVPVAHSAVVYQGIPVEKFPLKANPGSLGSPTRLLYAGQLHHYKGVHTLLQALQDLRGFSLTVVGTGPDAYLQQLRALAQGLEVSFVGRVPHDSLPEIYREHDIFVFPSIWDEPFGLTHLEAMASGLPVVSTTNGGQGEFLRDGENCLAFPAGDAAALARQLETLRDQDSLRGRLALAGRATVEQNFSLSRYLDDIEAKLLEVAA